MWEVDEVSACEDEELFVVVRVSEVLVGGGLDVEEALSDVTEVVGEGPSSEGIRKNC